MEPANTPNSVTAPGKPRPPEMGHVLFMDIVAYSKMFMDEQHAVLGSLQDEVLRNETVRRAQAADNLICLPTGDGMALVFFGNPQAPVECALELNHALRQHAEMKLRMGIHTGLLYRTADINAAKNVAGGGINMAQRVMDCGDAGHILVSKVVADFLGEVSTWSKVVLQDLGDVEVKHGVRIHIFNLYTDDAGNPALPMKVQAAAEAAAHPVPAALAEKGPQPGSRQKRNLWPYAAPILLLVLAAIAFLGWRHWNGNQGTQPPGARVLAGAGIKQSIILADFLNKTGDPVFDTTLDQALQIDLEQSPILDVVSQQHLRQSVKYMGKPEDTPITPDVAREIAVRQGIKAILTGTVKNLGTQYVVTLTAQNSATGDEIGSRQAEGPDKEHVLEALSRAAVAMRAKLGESLASIRKLDTPFAQATTPSLEAFRAYALGDHAHEKGHDIPDAESHYLRAVELDPKFAMAYARLGVVNENAGQDSQANEYFAKAFALSAKVSDRERLYIAAHYYSNVEGDLDKVVETLQESLATYPNQSDSYINLNVAYLDLGRPDLALPYAKEAVRIGPDNSIASENLISALLSLYRLPEAAAEAARARKLGIADGTVWISSYLPVPYLQGDEAEVSRMLAQAAGRPDEYLVQSAYGDLLQFSGEMKAAETTLREAYDQAGRNHAPDGQADALLTIAQGACFAGKLAGTKPLVQQARALDNGRPALMLAAEVAAGCQDGETAKSILDALAKQSPKDTLIHGFFLPYAAAYAALDAGDGASALRHADGMRKFDASYPSAYVRGLAALQVKDGAAAVAAFQAASRYRGLPWYVPAKIGLARAYVLAGDKANAKKTYESAFAEWKNADADLPLLVAAKKEYAAL